MGQPIDTASVEIVPDFSSFARQLKTGIDSALRGMVAQVDRAFREVERSAGEAGSDIGREISRGGERAEGALREVGTTAQIQMAKVGAAASTAGSAVSGRLVTAATIAKGALIGMALAVGAGLAAMVGFGLKSAASIEQVQIGLEALTGSAESAKAFLEELQQFAATTPFEFAGVADASRRILAFGQSVDIVQSEVIPTITTIGDLVSVLGGTQENVDAVVRAFGQVASKGRLMGGEILQISEALPGFNANQAIAASLGVSVAEAMEMQEKGEIDATTAINALLQGMAQFPGAAGAMEKQAGTLLGVFSTFKDTISIALTNAFQPVIPEIKGALAELTPILGQAIGQLAPMLGGLLSAILPLLGTFVQAIVPILTPILLALSQVANGIAPVLVPLGAAFGVLIQAIIPILPILSRIAVAIATALTPVIASLAPVLQVISTLFLKLLVPVLPLITRLGGLLAGIIGPAVRLVTTVFEQLGPPLFEIIGALAAALMPIIEALVPIVGLLIDAFMPFLPIIVSLLQPITKVILALMPLVNVIIALLPAVLAIITPLNMVLAAIVGFIANEAIVPLVELLAQALVLVLSPLNLLVPLIEDFTQTISSLDWGAIGRSIGGAFVRAMEAVRDFFANIRQWFAELPGRILDAVGNLGNTLVDAGKNLIFGLWSGISSLGGWLWGKIKSFVFDNILSPVGQFLGISSPSTVFRDQIGKQIPAGIAEGISAGIPDLQALIAPIIPGRGLPAGATASTGATISGITVNVMFSGVVPTETEARRTGAAAGAGVAEAIARRSIGLAVRTA